MNTGELLKSWLDFKGRDYTQKRLAYETGLTENTISFFINNRRTPGTSTIEKISRALDVSVAEFWAGPDEYRKNLKDLHEYTPGERIPGLGTMVGAMDESDTIPLLTSIPAGQWKEWHDQYPLGFGEEKIPRYGVKGKHVFALRVHGDSMVGEGLHEGDLIYIDPEIPFTSTRGGRIGVVKYNGNYKIRRVFLTGDGQHYRLVPANPNFEEEEAPAAETTVFKVVRWMPNTEGMF